MNEAAIQLAISALYEATSDIPSASDDDYVTRRVLINRALHRWEHNKGFWWDELWTSDESLTVLADTTEYDAPTNFRRAGGFVELYDGTTMIKRYPVIKPNGARYHGSGTYAYFKGNPNTGFKLVLSPTPVTEEVGKTIKYDYYKKATEYTATSTISEIPDPEYIVHSVVAELWKSDGNEGNYDSSLAEAEERLKGMEVAHVANIDWQDNSIPDLGDGFGY